MDYFEHHYALVNDLSPEGRRRTWFDLRYLYDRWLPSDRQARILDLGCGAGVLLEWLRDDRGFTQAIGLDASEGQVKFARSLGLTVEHTPSPASWLSTQRPFDAIFLVDVMEHLSSADVTDILRLIVASLRPGGRLILRVPNANSSFASRYRYIDATHERSYTELSLRSHLLGAGLMDVEICGDDIWAVRSLPGVVRIGLKLFARLFRRWSAAGEFGPEGLRIPLSLNLLATARRPVV